MQVSSLQLKNYFCWFDDGITVPEFGLGN